ncbi:hypothetical protein [Methylobacterium oxalidis]|uniref:hypothetical protein n=1 Tax=Methylobacterium oxalidis TaxID=944322 RepID=UPI003314764B
MLRFAHATPEDEALTKVEAHIAEAEQVCSRLRLPIERLRMVGQDPTTAEIRLAQFDRITNRLSDCRRNLLNDGSRRG